MTLEQQVCLIAFGDMPSDSPNWDMALGMTQRVLDAYFTLTAQQETTEPTD